MSQQYWSKNIRKGNKMCLINRVKYLSSHLYDYYVMLLTLGGFGMDKWFLIDPPIANKKEIHSAKEAIRFAQSLLD